MTEKEKQIQNALGLLNTYSGTTSVSGYAYPSTYKVQDVTLVGARKQLLEMIKRARKKLEVPLELELIVGEKEKIRDGWRRSVWHRPHYITESGDD